jgi:hypothetical protein
MTPMVMAVLRLLYIFTAITTYPQLPVTPRSLIIIARGSPSEGGRHPPMLVELSRLSTASGRAILASLLLASMVASYVTL